MKKQKKELNHPAGYKYMLGIMPFVIIIVGQFYPILGLILLGCMAAGITISLFNGRYWCSAACPRGAVFDAYAGKVSRGRKAPALFSHPVFRLVLLGVLMGVLGFRMVQSRGDMTLLGSSLVQMMLVTTSIGILLALTFKPRAWCMICPLATVMAVTGKGKNPVRIDDRSCIDCGKCYKVCPMDIRASDYRETGYVNTGDCIKCRECVRACPKDALS